MSVSICTDNRLMSNTSVTRELQLLADELSITPSQFRNIVVAGFKGSFFPGSYNEKRAYVRRILDRYEELETRLLGQASRNEFGSGMLILSEHAEYWT